MVDEKTLERVMNNPKRVNEEYEILNRPRPKITDSFKKDLHFTDLRSRLQIDGIIESISYEVEKAVKLGVRLINKIFQGKLRPTNKTDAYLEKWLEEQSGLFRGSMLYETKRQIITLMKQAIDEKWTIGKLAIQSEKLGNKLFSKGMATTVAIGEIHRAFENGKYITAKELEKSGKIIQKYRKTCEDDRVRETHMQAQQEGRVNIEHIFNSVGVKCPPGGYNCRCNLLYKEL